MVQCIEHLLGLGISDHLCLLVDIHVYTQTEIDKKPRLRRSAKPGNNIN
ncbi:hypothetical protein LSH36_25g07072 [Paralvinella palmiformis]|uniref:Uncharacterized protein n=1 Tax=Paralvinella palmiformis TaxID=53620 RepID=A0AAD9KBN1_9ANNE|nr:hypothetical protein LSH36_25g07072 [Paralvinella palmiformis]